MISPINLPQVTNVILPPSFIVQADETVRFHHDLLNEKGALGIFHDFFSLSENSMKKIK